MIAGSGMTREGTVLEGPAADAGRLKLFISYSRADLAFADELTAGLEYDGAFEVAIDRHSIIEGEDWKKRLGALIADADTIVFLLSPKSAASDICAWEVDEAVRLTKRIVPVLVAPLGTQPAPPALAALNYVRFDPNEDGKPRSFMAGLKALVRALKSDLGWLREHTRLLARASEWAEAGRPANRLLTGEAVGEAKAWAARRPKDAPALNALHLEFIAASEQAETARQGEAAQALAERERLVRQAEQAAKEREAALKEQRAALRRSARLQRVAVVLALAVIASLIAFVQRGPIMEHVHWLAVQLPYSWSNFRPYVLTAARERSLKPGETFRECAANCPEMVVIPAGSFLMGSPPTEKNRLLDEGPQQAITLARPFAVGKYDVTFAEWDACVSIGGCAPVADGGNPRGNSRPAINMTWDQAHKYTAWLSSMTGQPYRLLTESEYEYAARAARTTAYPWGDEVGEANAACIGCSNGGGDAKTGLPRIGMFKPNDFGLFDMHGTVMRWLEDCYANRLQGIPLDGSARTSSACSNRVVRGGSWLGHPEHIRSASRMAFPPDVQQGIIGLRVARTLLPPRQ